MRECESAGPHGPQVDYIYNLFLYLVPVTYYWRSNRLQIRIGYKYKFVTEFSTVDDTHTPPFSKGKGRMAREDVWGEEKYDSY